MSRNSQIVNALRRRKRLGRQLNSEQLEDRRLLALVAGDSFLSGANPAAGEYVDGLQLNIGATVQNPTVAGFTGGWNNGGTSLWKSVAGGLSAPALGGESGGSVRFQWPDEVGKRDVQRNLTTTPPFSTGGEVWITGLVSNDAANPGNDGYAYAGFSLNRNNNSGTQGLRFGVEGDGTEMDLVLRHRSGAITAESLVLLDG